MRSVRVRPPLLLTLFLALTASASCLRQTAPIDYVGSPTYAPAYKAISSGKSELPASSLRGSGDEATQRQEATRRVEWNERLNQGKSPGDIMVIPGSLSRPHTVLGPVAVDTRGIVNVGQIFVDSLTRSELERQLAARPKTDSATIYGYLQQKAYELYGINCDAVVNASVRFAQDGEVYAEGTAVRYDPEPQQPSRRELPVAQKATTEDRLKELQALLDAGLITRDEYDRKRAKILDEL